MKLDYSPQVNQYLQPYLQKLDPQLQQLVKQMTPQQINQAVQANPQLLDLVKNTQAQPQPQQQANTQRFLDKLQEEASEIIQAVSKIRRFGPDAHHPERETSNKTELVGELEDFLALVAVLEAQGYLDLSQSKDAITKKAEALLK